MNKWTWKAAKVAGSDRWTTYIGECGDVRCVMDVVDLLGGHPATATFHAPGVMLCAEAPSLAQPMRWAEAYAADNIHPDVLAADGRFLKSLDAVMKTFGRSTSTRTGQAMKNVPPYTPPTRGEIEAMAKRQDRVRELTACLVEYLYKTGKLDWAGGRWAEWNDAHGLVEYGADFDELIDNILNKKLLPPAPPRPMGFWRLLEGNVAIGYAGDVREARAEFVGAGDAEAVVICNILLEMTPSEREQVGNAVNAKIRDRVNGASAANVQPETKGDTKP